MNPEARDGDCSGGIELLRTYGRMSTIGESRSGLNGWSDATLVGVALGQGGRI